MTLTLSVSMTTLDTQNNTDTASKYDNIRHKITLTPPVSITRLDTPNNTDTASHIAFFVIVLAI